MQLAILVGRGDLGLAAWSLFGLLAAASLFLGARRPEQYRYLPPFALILSLALLFLQAARGAGPTIAAVAATITLVFAGVAAPLARRGPDRAIWAGVASAALVAPVMIMRLVQPGLIAMPLWGGLLLLSAAAVAVLAWSLRPQDGDELDVRLGIAAASALLPLLIATHDLLPLDLLPAAWLTVALVYARAASALRERSISVLALVAAWLGVLLAMTRTPELASTLAGSMLGFPAQADMLPSPMQALTVLFAPALLLLSVWRGLAGHWQRYRAPLPIVACALAAGAVYIWFKQIFGIETEEEFVRLGFAERMVLTQALFAGGWWLLAQPPTLRWIDRSAIVRTGWLLTGLAAARLVWFDVMIHNPVVTAQYVGSIPVVSLILPAFFGSAYWLDQARRRAEQPVSAWFILFLVALFTGVMLTVRQAFHGGILTAPGTSVSEFYVYSLAGLLFAVALLVTGVRLRDKPLRLAGLILLTATILKVFLVDASAIEGILRILSFLGLGIALIGIGRLYARMLRLEGRKAAAEV